LTSRAVSRLPVHAGPAGWSAILPAALPRATLLGTRGCDVAIVGAGFAGLSAARRLLQIDPGLKVAVIEAGRVAEGAAGRNSGFMIDLPHELTSSDYAGTGQTRDRVLTRLNRHAIDFAEAAVRDHGIAPAFFQRAGKINGAASDAAMGANRSYAAHLAALGEGHEMLDAQAMKAATGSDWHAGGLFTPGTAMLQPAGYIRGLAEGLERAGAEIFERSPVQRYESVGGGWRLITKGGALSAAKVILAGNGHLESFGFAAGRLMHIMLHACMTGPIKQGALGEQTNWGVTPADPMGATLRRISGPDGDRIVIRQGAGYRPDMQSPARDMARLARGMRAKFDTRFPTLKGLRFDHARSGHLCLTRNAVSVMRELEPGLFSACVQNGLGTARGALTGIGAAELACGRTSEITDMFLAEAAPERLPPHPIDTIGANLYLRWKEWQARRD
jgi:glycine/D-amino acid oxidase-like deaminating enzyme